MEEILEVDKPAYNAFVQTVQSEAAHFGIGTTVEAVRDRSGKIAHANFAAYWDGHWHTLGTERPFVGPKNEGRIYPSAWERIKAQAARDLAK